MCGFVCFLLFFVCVCGFRTKRDYEQIIHKNYGWHCEKQEQTTQQTAWVNIILMRDCPSFSTAGFKPMSSCFQLDEGCTALRTMIFEHFCSHCDVKYISHFLLLRLLFDEFGWSFVRGDVYRIRIFICIYSFLLLLLRLPVMKMKAGSLYCNENVARGQVTWLLEVWFLQMSLAWAHTFGKVCVCVCVCVPAVSCVRKVDFWYEFHCVCLCVC